MVGGLDGQNPTAACGRLQPGSVTQLSSFWTLEVENPPFGRTRGNLVTTRASFLVSHIPMPYPNKTKQKSPQVYPLSMPVKGVDGEVRLFPIGVRVSGKRCSGASESNQTQGGDTS